MPKATQLITCGVRTRTACPGSQTNTLWLPHIAIPDSSSGRRDAFSQNKGSEATHHPHQHRFAKKKKKKKSLQRKGDMNAGNVADAPFPFLWKAGANKSFSSHPGGRGQDRAPPGRSSGMWVWLRKVRITNKLPYNQESTACPQIQSHIQSSPGTIAKSWTFKHPLPLPGGPPCPSATARLTSAPP